MKKWIEIYIDKDGLLIEEWHQEGRPTVTIPAHDGKQIRVPGFAFLKEFIPLNGEGPVLIDALVTAR